MIFECMEVTIWMMKIAHDLVRVKDVVESKYSRREIEKFERSVKKMAEKRKIPYITFLSLVIRSNVAVMGRLLAIYVLYVK